MAKIHVNTSKPYDVIIGSGLLEKAGELIADAVKGRKAVIVTDDIVNALYAEKLLSSMEKAGFKGGRAEILFVENLETAIAMAKK